MRQPKGGFVDVDGMLIERDVYRIAEKVKEINPRLSLCFLNPDARINPTDPPFAVVELCNDGIRRIVLTAWELDDRIIQRIHDADTTRRNVLEAIDNKNAQIKKEQNQRYQEIRQEQVAIAAAILGTSKDTYVVNLGGKQITFKSNEPARVKVKD